MYNKNISNLIEDFDSDLENGLDSNTVEKQKETFGLNELKGKKKQSLFVKFLLEFKDPLIIILLVAAIISLAVDPSEWIESLIIFIVIIVNAILGVFQENKAEKSLEALQKMSSPLCKVLREGVMMTKNGYIFDFSSISWDLKGKYYSNTCLFHYLSIWTGDYCNILLRIRLAFCFLRCCVVFHYCNILYNLRLLSLGHLGIQNVCYLDHLVSC